MRTQTRWFFAVAAVAAPVALHATSMVSLNLAQIVEGAESAFVGKLVESSVVETPHGWAEEVTMSVVEPIYGAETKTITWRQFRMSESSRLVGMPEYAPEQEYFLLLSSESESTGFRAPFGLGQGAFVLHRDEETSRTLVRNEFSNSHLMQNIDGAKVAEEVVAKRKGAKSLTPEQRTRAVRTVEADLRNAIFGTADFETLKQTVRVMKATKNPGEKFAREEKDSPSVLHGHSAGRTASRSF